MKYSININQLVLSQYKNLDIKDAAILDYLIAFCAADDKKIDQMDWKENNIVYRYTWINYQHLINELPLLHFKQTTSINQRFNKLTEIGFIKTFTKTSEINGQKKVYVRLTEKIKELSFKEGVRKSGGPTNVYSEANESRFGKHNINRTYNTSSHSRAISYFVSSVEEKFGFKPLINGSKDGALLKKALTKFNEEQVKNIIRFYLSSEKFEKHGPNLSVALSIDTMNKWLKATNSSNWQEK